MIIRFDRGAARLVLLASLLPIVCGGCVFTRDGVKAVKLADGAEPRKIKEPAKVHLDDGSVVLFYAGFTLADGVLAGTGDRYDLTRRERTKVESVPLARVAAVEAPSTEVRPVASFFGVVLGGPAALVLFKAVFGSCPTVYAPGEGDGDLEAELFSHSIVRRFEGVDTDRLEQARPVGGELRLGIRNEALETHYVNRLELVAADVPSGYEAFPTPQDRIVLLGAGTPLRDPRSRSGRPVGGELAARDGSWYQGGPEVERALAERGEDDWVEGAIAVPPGTETATIALKARNTLLDTVLLYETLLGAQGVGALEWLARFERSPLAALRWHRWFERRFGLRVLVDEGAGFEEVARFPVTGPIAWHQAAVTFPAPRVPSARLRLQSIGDNWQIDWVGVSFERAPAPRVTAVPPVRVTGPGGTDRQGAVAALRRADGDYLVTGPGDRLEVAFPADPAPAGASRAWFLRSRGYYIEWLRKEWLVAAAALPIPPPVPGDEVVLDAARRWVAGKQALEQEFFSSRIGGAAGAGR